MSDILAYAREWLADAPVGERMGRTHDSECYKRHRECLVRRLADEVARLREERRWIPVEEKLPSDNVAVLVWGPCCGGAETVWREHGQWWLSFVGTYIPDSTYTHWMPLPEKNEAG